MQEHPMPEHAAEALRKKLEKLFEKLKPNPFSGPP